MLELPDQAHEGVGAFIDAVLSDIQRGQFGEVPTNPAPKYSDDFAWICQDNSIIDEFEGDN